MVKGMSGFVSQENSSNESKQINYNRYLSVMKSIWVFLVSVSSIVITVMYSDSTEDQRFSQNFTPNTICLSAVIPCNFPDIVLSTNELTINLHLFVNNLNDTTPLTITIPPFIAPSILSISSCDWNTLNTIYDSIGLMTFSILTNCVNTCESLINIVIIPKLNVGSILLITYPQLTATVQSEVNFSNNQEIPILEDQGSIINFNKLSIIDQVSKRIGNISCLLGQHPNSIDVVSTFLSYFSIVSTGILLIDFIFGKMSLVRTMAEGSPTHKSSLT
jgi:hypothetical protein